MNDRLGFILDAYAKQAPVLFLVAASVWEGHIQSCLDGVVVAVVRPVDGRSSYTEQRWQLEEIADMGLVEPEHDDEGQEDELFVTARRMAEQAREYGEMSLAERLLHKRALGEEHGHRG